MTLPTNKCQTDVKKKLCQLSLWFIRSVLNMEKVEITALPFDPLEILFSFAL